MNKRVVTILTVVIVILCLIAMYYELNKNKYDSSKKIVNEIVIDNDNKNNGNIAGYEYEISTNCGLSFNPKKLSNKGYYIIYQDKMTSPLIYLISAGTHYNNEISSLEIKDDILYIIINENDMTEKESQMGDSNSAGANIYTSCIKLLKDGKSPIKDNIKIINQNNEEYQIYTN